jgi:hypothetical protein
MQTAQDLSHIAFHRRQPCLEAKDVYKQEIIHANTKQVHGILKRQGTRACYPFMGRDSASNGTSIVGANNLQ